VNRGRRGVRGLGPEGGRVRVTFITGGTGLIGEMIPRLLNDDADAS
jgi:hypothetical protein